MKIGLKLCSVLMVLPLVMGVQKHHSDSLYTDLTIGAGGGSYGNTFYTRTYTPGSGTGCDGSGGGGYWTPHENREKINYNDLGIGLETTTSKKTKLGIRLGYIKDTRIEIHNEIYTKVSKTSYIVNPHFSLNGKGSGLGQAYLWLREVYIIHHSNRILTTKTTLPETTDQKYSCLVSICV